MRICATTGLNKLFYLQNYAPNATKILEKECFKLMDHLASRFIGRAALNSRNIVKSIWHLGAKLRNARASVEAFRL